MLSAIYMMIPTPWYRLDIFPNTGENILVSKDFWTKINIPTYSQSTNMNTTLRRTQQKNKIERSREAEQNKNRYLPVELLSMH